MPLTIKKSFNHMEGEKLSYMHFENSQQENQSSNAERNFAFLR